MNHPITQPLAAPSQQDPTLTKGGRVSLHDYIATFFALDIATLIFCGLFFPAQLRLEPDAPPLASSDSAAWAVALAIAFYLAAAQPLQVYSTRYVMRPMAATQRSAASLLFAFAMLMVIAVATKTTESYSRLWFFPFVLESLSLVVFSRVLLVWRLHNRLARGAYIERAISVGVCCEPIRSSEIARQTGNAVQVVSEDRFDGPDKVAALSDQIAHFEIDQVFISAPWSEIPTLSQKLEPLRRLSTKTFLLPADGELSREITRVGKFGDHLSLCAVEKPIHGWSLWFKRAEDLIIAFAALACFAPVMALVALAIRLDSPGPVFFRQVRTGFNGRHFQLWKFRSMYVEMTDEMARRQTSKDDARVTRVGRIIRRLSLDELPQLFNVVDGTMSIVGPRPHALLTKAEGRNLDELVDYYAVRHRVKPGMTGWAQVHGFRGELDSVEKLRARVNYDLEYIDRWTIWLDLEIVFRTAMLLFQGDKHAY